MMRTKVVATMGPAAATPEVVTDLVRAGMDIARINMSHGHHEHHRRGIGLVREASRRVGRPVAVLADLQGPKLRLGHLDEPVHLRDGSTVAIVPEGDHAGDELPTAYDRLARDVSRGTQLLLDDGQLELECVNTDGTRAVFRVLRGGVVRSRKGMNLPGISVNTPSITEKDERDLEVALDMDVEYIGLSFVRNVNDVLGLKDRIKGRAWLVSKIEKAQALDELDGILAFSDAVMVARGDLGVELPFASVPLAQKRIIQAANGYACPVITATQMLESMTTYPSPTRAETSDVANAILDGTDAVMLSGETAVGKHPVRTLEVMVRIAAEIEESGVLEEGPHYLAQMGPVQRRGASPREHAVAASSVRSARDLNAPAIIVITRSGFSARLVASYRPPIPIFSVCTEPKVHRQLCGVWGVHPVLADKGDITYQNLTDFGKRVVLGSGKGRTGDPVVVTSGLPFHKPGSTNTMRVEQL
ncbi:MAG: pyruvate kinase [Gemmatimonadota bacterium]|nr:pyruvate kinase [Gemmatimonadota bacterium]MDE2871243.1 pyruvate kinase [Gemmatimonadota bacterium]